MIRFPQIVKARMAALSLSQRRLSMLTGHAVSQQHLSDWLSGKHRLSDDKLSAVLEVLGCVEIEFKNQ
ncbi:MAG: helix-turn-helix transcriptional regulator [Methylococcales bacterium]|nr:helix-turn-helix transcriptional regulator [Methylococcales bacterium]